MGSLQCPQAGQTGLRAGRSTKPGLCPVQGQGPSRAVLQDQGRDARFEQGVWLLGRRVTDRCLDGYLEAGSGLAVPCQDPKQSQTVLCQAGSREHCRAESGCAKWGCARQRRARSLELRGTGLCQPDPAKTGARPSAMAGHRAGEAAASVLLPKGAGGRARAHAVALAVLREPSLAPRSPPARPALSVPPGLRFPCRRQMLSQPRPSSSSFSGAASAPRSRRPEVPAQPSLSPARPRRPR